MEMLFKAIKMIFKKENMDVLIFLVACHLGVLFGAWWFTKPYFDKDPCTVCGRAQTKPVKTLYQYKVENGIPFMKEKNVYYCEHHIDEAPRVIRELHDEEDTNQKRLMFSTVLSSVLLFLIVFSAAVLEIDFNYLLIFPFILGGAFLFLGPSSNITTTGLFILLFAAPFGIYFAWLRNENKRFY